MSNITSTSTSSTAAPAPNAAQFEKLRLYILKECGIDIPPNKTYLFESRLRQLVIETQSSNYDDFLIRAINDKSGNIREKIVDAITTNETYWFRDERPWHLITKHFIPLLSQSLQKKEKPKVRIWSAACSSGQEPYSLAMLIDQHCKANPLSKISPDQFEILATDISPSALFLAIAGRYNRIAMSRGISDHFKNNYFTESNGIYSIHDTIKKRVNFKKFNLQSPFQTLGSTFDLILCRNVIIYFSDEFKRDLYSRFAQSLTTNGLFLLGSSESLVGFDTKFKLQEFENVIYYIKP